MADLRERRRGPVWTVGTWIGRRLAGDRGSSSVTLAICWPAVMVITFAAIQVAVKFLADDIALTAAQEAVTAQRAYNAQDGVGVARANAYLADAGDYLVNYQVVVTRTGDDVQATVTGQSLTFLWRFNISQTVHGRVERFTTEDDP